MDYHVFSATDRWLDDESPMSNMAVTSRARFARNLTGFPFVPHARKDVLERIDQFIEKAIRSSEALKDFERIELKTLSATDRSFLKESRLISKEMESGSDFLTVYMAPDAMASILVNEEDHLRIQVLEPGLQMEKAIQRLQNLDDALGDVLAFAYSDRFGYLTACPSNVGTGLRASAMMHLPGLTMLREIESSLQGIAHYGLTTRGFHGENTDFTGDFYQISNEVTLGKTPEQIIDVLNGVIERIMDREEEARINLFKNHSTVANDSIWRSYALLSYARRIDSQEAMRLLSRLRLGIEQGYFPSLSHHELNRLVMDVQPAHLERQKDGWGATTSRDEARANLLRERIRSAVEKN
ncbi:ATP--guanido phosphotransferase [bacterium]|nr:ATP--guanido phosphotransferase [bacterium]